MMLKVMLIALIAVPACAFGHDPKVTDEQILTWLKELKPLPKVHYSWPLPLETLLLTNCSMNMRGLTHAVSLSGEWVTPKQIEQAVVVCNRINAEKPTIPLSIGINYSVWVRRFGEKLPPTDTGPTHQAELDFLKTRMEMIRDSLTALNRKHKTNVAISAVLFDCERFHVRPDDVAWNLAITAKYNSALDIVSEIFPHVRMEWYARGDIHPSASSTGWSESNFFTFEEHREQLPLVRCTKCRKLVIRAEDIPQNRAKC